MLLVGSACDRGGGTREREGGKLQREGKRRVDTQRPVRVVIRKIDAEREQKYQCGWGTGADDDDDDEEAGKGREGKGSEGAEDATNL